MMWRWIKQLPKFAFVAAVILGSSTLFGLWWVTHPHQSAGGGAAATENVAPKIARIEAHPKTVILVDNDLYDLDTGVIIFRGWLKEGTPIALYYDSASAKIVARYERGFVRYGLDGKEEATLIEKSPPAFSDNLKWALLERERDLWRADIDWTALKFLVARRLTSIEQFSNQFAANIVLSTETNAIIRNNGRLLRVNLASGEVKPASVSMLHLAKRRSPNGRYLLGEDRGRLFLLRCRC